MTLHDWYNDRRRGGEAMYASAAMLAGIEPETAAAVEPENRGPLRRLGVTMLSVFDRRVQRHAPCMPGGALAPQRITDAEAIPEILAAVYARVYPDSSARGIAAELRERIDSDQSAISFFAVTERTEPVGLGWTEYFPDASVAQLCGGAVIPDYRRRGLYTALVTARAAEAVERGVEYLVVEVAPRERRIPESIGFRAFHGA